MDSGPVVGPVPALAEKLVLNLNFEVVCNQDVYFLFSVALTTWMPYNWFVPVSVC